jgi:hypothetical protein
MARGTGRGRKSKNEVQAELEAVREEALAAKESSNPKLAEAERIREAELREATQGLSLESVAVKISTLNADVTKGLSELSGQLMGEVQRLAGLREMIALETRSLERLHKLDVAKTGLDQLLEEHEAQKREFEAEVERQRAAWAAEQEEHDRAVKETEDALKKQRQREADDYEYKKAQERKKAQDKWDEEVRVQEKRNQEKQELLEKQWAVRESALKLREDELAKLRSEVDGFAARLKQAVEQATADATQAVEQRYQHELVLLRKDNENERRMAELRIKSMEDLLSRQALQVQSLTAQLEEAKKQVQDIAVKAIEGASGARALSHVNQIAIEQAKTRTSQS